MAVGDINILGAIVDISKKGTVAYTNQIKDLYLNQQQGQINLLFQQEIKDLKNQINTDNLKSEIYQYILQHLEDILPKDKIQHIFLTQEEYDALQSYEENALYFIVEEDEPVSTVWGLGDNLPIILSGEGWLLGDSLPIILS